MKLHGQQQRMRPQGRLKAAISHEVEIQIKQKGEKVNQEQQLPIDHQMSEDATEGSQQQGEDQEDPK